MFISFTPYWWKNKSDRFRQSWTTFCTCWLSNMRPMPASIPILPMLAMSKIITSSQVAILKYNGGKNHLLDSNFAQQ